MQLEQKILFIENRLTQQANQITRETNSTELKADYSLQNKTAAESLQNKTKYPTKDNGKPGFK